MTPMPDSSPPAATTLRPVLTATALQWPWSEPPLWRLDTLQLTPGVSWVGGAEGRGKTSLLRMLAGELAVSGSTLLLSGHQAAGSEAYRQRVFWMDPRTEAFDAITATEFFTSTATRYPTWDDALLTHLVTVLNLQVHQDKPLYMLSTGSKRKVWIAAALASGATLTLLDAPLAALDRASIDHLLEFLRAAAQHPHRAWVVADYVPPPGVPLAYKVDLGDS